MSPPTQLERYFCIWAGLGGDEDILAKAHPCTTCKNCTRQVADDFISSRMSTVPKQSLTSMVEMKILCRKSLRRKMCILSRWGWLCDPMGCSLPGSSVHGISQARILKWAAISSSRGSSWSENQSQVSCVSCIGRHILYHQATWETPRRKMRKIKPPKPWRQGMGHSTISWNSDLFRHFCWGNISFQDCIKNRYSFVCSFIQKAFSEYLLDDKNYARAWDFKDVSYK